MDYYATLGLKRGASDADIKKAYRSLAMKHHPDRGGDEAKFKEISQAYEFLTDPQKKQMIDSGLDPNAQGQGFHGGGPFEYHFNTGDLNDIFANFGFGGAGFGRQPRQNKSLSINIEISLEEVLNGKELNAEIGMPGGKTKIINITIPPGLEHGQQIRYGGMGDNTYPNLRPGDLIVNVFVRPHPVFRRDRESLILEKTISVWDAILGTNIDIDTIDGKRLSITVPPGTQPETMLSCKGEGLPNARTKQRGSLLIRLKVSIPRTLTGKQREQIIKIQNDGI